MDIHITNKTKKSWEVVYIIEKVRQLFSKHSQEDCFVGLVEGGTDRKSVVLCCKVIDACTTSNDVWVKSKFVLNVMLEPKVDLYTVAIPPPRDRDWRENYLTSNPLGASSTVFASSPWALSHVSVTKKRSTPLSFINADISQRLQAMSLPFTDCALNEATMNGCKFCFFLITARLEGWRHWRWYLMFKSLRRSTVERLSKDVFVFKERSSVRV